MFVTWHIPLELLDNSVCNKKLEIHDENEKQRTQCLSKLNAHGLTVCEHEDYVAKQARR